VITIPQPKAINGADSSAAPLSVNLPLPSTVPMKLNIAIVAPPWTIIKVRKISCAILTAVSFAFSAHDWLPVSLINTPLPDELIKLARLSSVANRREAPNRLDLSVRSQRLK
jgi:hypothetical protein